jgi:inorganic phosphate transporter, PiT family
MGSTFFLVLVIVTAVAFDFTNGFHDTANAVATSIATGALKPIVAVVMSGCLNFLGAFISISVAATIAKGVVDPSVAGGPDGLQIVLAALLGAIVWNLTTWCLSLPSSSSHAIIGGLVGAAIAAVGWHAVSFNGILGKVVAPAVLAVFICGGVAAIGTFAAYWMVNRLGERQARTGYRYGQVGSAALVSLAHGTNDAQKTMGIIALALIATGHINAAHFYVPIWVKFICAGAIALGTVTGGWRIINTMGNRITQIESPQGFAAEAASGSVILASSYYGYPLSTTQVVSGGVTGAGIGKKQPVHWAVFGHMVSAWVLTIPAAGVMGAAAYEISDIFGTNSDAGAIVTIAITIVIAAVLWVISRRTAVTAKDLDRTGITPEQEAERAAAGQAAAPATV